MAVSPASTWRTQPGEDDLDEPVDRGLGWQYGGGGEGVQAVAGEFVRCDIGAEHAGLGAFGEYTLDQVVELLLRVGDLLVTVQEPYELGVVVAAGLVDDQGVRRQHGFQSGSLQAVRTPAMAYQACTAALAKLSEPEALWIAAGDGGGRAGGSW
jgi:hypothetical protein